MILAPIADPPQAGKIDLFPRILHGLNEGQRHVLARAAVHRWHHVKDIPFIPSTAHQTVAAFSLTAPGVRFLVPTSLRPSFSITRRGELAVMRLFHVVSAWWDYQREVDFDEIVEVMKNRWEP